MIGRVKEIEELQSYLNSNKSEFVAVYGRRRVGKTFLIYETLQKELCFDVTGLYKRPTREQLENFHNQMVKAGWKGPQPKKWTEAFKNLSQLLEKSKRKRKVLFIDEMPWMDTQRSGFISALEHFWNSWAARRKDIMLIACGSATTWMMSKLINARGGLYNRLTHQMLIRPFTLTETEQMLQSKKIRWVKEQVAECYMIMGGIPYYLNLLNPKLSLAQNVDNLFFKPVGEMAGEFDKLFASLFDRPDYYIKIVAALGRKAAGMTRAELVANAKIQDGGNLSKALKSLDNCCFIRKYNDFIHRKNDPVYQLIDPFCLFYYKFMEGDEYRNASHPWVSIQGTHTFSTWSGYAFEMLCLLHIEQIKTALGIGAVSTNVFSWRGKGFQIDLLIDRQDRVINVCELKFSGAPYAISNKYRKELDSKLKNFKEAIAAKRPHKSIALTFITANGLKENTYSYDVVAKTTLDKMF